MKKIDHSIIHELARELDQDVAKVLPLQVNLDNSVFYQDFIISQNSNNKWNLYYKFNKIVIADFFLKSCAIIAANKYYLGHFDKYQQIRNLDHRYQSYRNDFDICKHNLKKSQDENSKEILFSKLNEVKGKIKKSQLEISRLFKLILYK